MSDENPIDLDSQRNLIEKGYLLEQLLQSERFVEFFKYNFDLVRNEEEKELCSSKCRRRRS